MMGLDDGEKRTRELINQFMNLDQQAQEIQEPSDKEDNYISNLINDLGSLDKEVHERAIKLLTGKMSECFHKVLEALRTSSSDLVKFNCLEIVDDWKNSRYKLKEKNQKKINDALVEVVRETNPKIQAKAIEILGDIGEYNDNEDEITAIGNIFIEIIKDCNVTLRNRVDAAYELGKIGYDLQGDGRYLSSRISDHFFETVNMLYVNGEILFEVADSFFESVQYFVESIDKGTVAAPKKKPDDLKRMMLSRPKTQDSKRKTGNRKRLRGAAGG